MLTKIKDNRIQNEIVQINMYNVFGLEKFPRTTLRQSATKMELTIRSMHSNTHIHIKMGRHLTFYSENVFQIPILDFFLFLSFARIIYTFREKKSLQFERSKKMDVANEMIILIVRCASVSVFIFLSVMNYGPYCFVWSIHVLYSTHFELFYKTFAFGAHRK